MSDLIPFTRQVHATLNEMPPVPPSPSGDYVTGLSFRDFLALMRRNRWLVLLGTVATAAPVAYFALHQQPTYQAQGLIRLVGSQGVMSSGLGSAVASQVVGANTDAIRSQLAVLQGREVLGQVVDREGLRLESLERGLPRGDLTDVRIAPAVQSDTIELHFTTAGVEARGQRQVARAAYGQPFYVGGVGFSVAGMPAVPTATLAVVPREVATDRLAEKLSAQPRERTDAVSIEYAAADPRVAQGVVNAVIDVFQRFNAEEAQRASQRRRVFLEEQLRSTNTELEAAQSQLSDYRTGQQLFSSRERMATQQQGLLALDTQHEQLAAESRMYSSLLAEAQQQGVGARSSALRTLVSSPGMASNIVVSSLFAQLADHEAGREALTAGPQGSTESHPDVARLDVLIASTQAKLLDAVRSHGAALDAQVRALDGLRARQAGEMQPLPGLEAEEERLRQHASTVLRMSDRLQEELQVARMAEAVEGGQVSVVHLAPLPSEPVDAGLRWKLALGLLVGLLLGTGGALAREATNTSIRRRDELGSLLAIPDLGVIPRIATGGDAWLKRRWSGRGAPAPRPGGRQLVAADDAESAGAEAYRILRTNLNFSTHGEACRTVMVTSPAPGEGKTTTVTNLAVSYALQGYRVVLVDCDLRRPRLHQVFSVHHGPGLVHALRGECTLPSLLQETGVPGLSVIASGDVVLNPSELLGSTALREVLRTLSGAFDLVLLDAPPVLAASDAAVLATQVDGVVLVVQAGRTDRTEARQAGAQLVAVGARLLGAVLNDPSASLKQQGAYQYYGHYTAKGA